MGITERSPHIPRNGHIHPVITHPVVSGQLPRRTISHRTGFGPEEWFYSVVVVLVGSCPGGE